MLLYTHKQTKEAKNMVIKKINEFYYDSNISGIMLVLNGLKTNKEKLLFIAELIEATKRVHHNITVSRILTSLCMMYNAIQNNETIILEG